MIMKYGIKLNNKLLIIYQIQNDKVIRKQLTTKGLFFQPQNKLQFKVRCHCQENKYYNVNKNKIWKTSKYIFIQAEIEYSNLFVLVFI